MAYVHNASPLESYPFSAHGEARAKMRRSRAFILTLVLFFYKYISRFSLHIMRYKISEIWQDTTGHHQW